MTKKKAKPPQPLLWPPYFSEEWTERTLAYFRDGMLYWESGQTMLTSTFATFIEISFVHNLLIFVDDLLCCFPDECVRWGEVFCSPPPEAKRIACVFRGRRNTTRWIIHPSAYGCMSVGPTVLEDIRIACRMAKIGTPNSAGAMGQLTMRKILQEQYPHGEAWRHRHRRPPGACVRDVRTWQIGSRNDLFVGPAESIEEILEVDRKNAYAAEYCKLPTGPAYPFNGRHEDDYETFLCLATVRLETDISVPGPFPRRNPDNSLSYPYRAGTYENVPLWKEEVQATRERGGIVTCGRGWGWDEMTTDMNPWVDFMSELRENAPNERVAHIIKRAITAGIGRHSMPEYKYILSAEEESDIRAVYQGLPYDYFVVKVPDKRPHGLPHWPAYVWMKCRLALYNEMRKHNRVYASDTDAIYIPSPSDVCYPGKDDYTKTGDWRVKVLHGKPCEGTFPAARHLNTQERQKRPGVKK